MIEGIEILNEVNVPNHPVLATIVIILGVIISIGSIVCAVFAFIDDCPGPAITLLIFVIFGVLFVFAGIDELKQQPETHYQVLIDDTVPMSKIYEKYEIVEQNGKIFTIKEKAQ